jgi:hypothetical protein
LALEPIWVAELNEDQQTPSNWIIDNKTKSMGISSKREIPEDIEVKIGGNYN